MTRDFLLSFLLDLLLGSCYVLPTVMAQTCQPDWILFGESCYGFGEEKLTWVEADDVCGRFGGKLAEIETAEENEFLTNECRSKFGGACWLGGTDIFHEGVWRWVSTGDLINSFTDWGSGQPNDWEGQDCLAIYDSSDYQWGDGPCDSQHIFICEANPLEEPIVG